MWSLIAFLVVGAIWPWLGMKGIDCQLRFDVANTHEAEATVARLIVTNRWPIPVFGLTVEGEFLQDIFEDEDRVAVGLQRIPSWSESEFKWEFKPARRGLLPSEVPAISTGFPFGIYNSQRPVSADRQVVVWPKCEKISAVGEMNGSNFNIEGMMSDRPGTDGDVIGARPFRQGDLLRHVNWAKTARSGNLIVLERQTAAQKTIRILVDLHPQRHFGRESQSTYEWAIRIAATIGKHLHLHQSHIRLQCLGLGDEFSSETTNHRGLTPLMNFLAMLPALDELQANGLTPEIEATVTQIRPDEEVYLISTDPTAKTRLLKTAAEVHEILLSSNIATEPQPLSGSEIPEANGRLVVDDRQMPQEQFRKGWERLYSHA